VVASSTDLSLLEAALVQQPRWGRWKQGHEGQQHACVRHACTLAVACLHQGRCGTGIPYIHTASCGVCLCATSTCSLLSHTQVPSAPVLLHPLYAALQVRT
jgi:hypothetical protein